MDVTVSSRHVEVTAALRRLATEKVGRLDRFLEGIERAEVHFCEERTRRSADRDVCEVTMEGHGEHIRAKCAAADPFAALELVVDKLERQLHRRKSKLLGRSHPRRNGSATNGTAPPGGGGEDEDGTLALAPEVGSEAGAAEG